MNAICDSKAFHAKTYDLAYSITCGRCRIWLKKRTKLAYRSATLLATVADAQAFFSFKIQTGD